MTKDAARSRVWLALTLGVGLFVLMLVLLQPFVGAEAAALPAETTASQDDVVAGTSEGWQTVLNESFESGMGPGWTVTDTSAADGGEYTWGADAVEPGSPMTAAWSVGGGAQGANLTAGVDSYPDHVDSWMIYGPVDLAGAWDAYVQFSWWMGRDGSSPTADLSRAAAIQGLERVDARPSRGDWLGWCVLTDPNELATADCSYVSGGFDAWMRGAIPLEDYASASQAAAQPVWFAFRFLSDGDGRAGPGAFIDDVELRVNRGYRSFMPLVGTEVSTPTYEPPALVTNGGFEEAGDVFHRVRVLPAGGDPQEVNDTSIATPPGWLTWYYDQAGTWHKPQVESLATASEAVQARRVLHGDNATLLYTSYRKHHAGFLQQVEVRPGTQVRLEAWAHAWSNNGGGPAGREEDAGWSEGAGFNCFYAEEGDEGLTSDQENVAFSVGIDPTGGVDPGAETVQWGTGAHIYNCYHQVPTVTVEAQSQRVTLFLRSHNRWAFKHNHAYWDDVKLVEVDGDGKQSAWKYPVVAQGSKIGIHSIWNPGPDILGGSGGPDVSYPVVKAVDDLGWLAEVKERHPETLIIARLTSPVEGCHNVEDPATDLDEMANALMSHILNAISTDPSLREVVDYWEVANEPDPPGVDGDEGAGYRRLAELMIAAMERAEVYDLNLALFSPNAGTPEWVEMEAMVETGAFAHARAGGHILTVHEGTFATHDPQYGWGSSIGGDHPVVDGAGSLNFRYRYLYHLLEQRDEVIPLVVSEWYCGDEESATVETLINALKWYDSEASKDYYFWAALPFTLGPTSQWEHTNYRRVYEGGLIDYIIGIEDRENAPLPAHLGR